jgi:GDPmannose 4,6-dehydratase
MNKKRALITGVTGQDGSYIAELLLSKNYDVYGLKRRTSSEGYGNVVHLLNEIKIIEGDLLDQTSLNSAVKEIKPDECYHLAAQSHVKTSFDQPLYTADCTGLGTLRLLEALREFSPSTRFYNAATSELFGEVQEMPQTEKTSFHPRSPYGIAKQFSYWTTVNYKESYKMFASNGILFNHSSPRRGEEFATRKITKSAAKIKLGLQDQLFMGNIDAKRDEGHAKDYVEAMYLMLQYHTPDNFVVSTGETHSIREMIEVAFGHLGLDSNKYVKIDPKLFRPAEVNILCGDSSKMRKALGWKPKYNWKDLLVEMVENDLTLLKKDIK